MAFEGERRILPRHAVPVVFDANIRLAADADVNFKLRRARVNRIFDQFLDDRRRAFDDFPGGDMVRDFGGEDVDFRTHSSRFSYFSHSLAMRA
ncbi:hypothetical protein U14_04744 [Candidatus Moduliflexus flocculans]|uniref:Uncharacterized protein n=1 Tax=Candidatus Moduliflexus flocculans TaxID=1499966 RepID=A0A0S6W135_9BACT|nr:hypothetical protein U14_04744 [Candidatus Moduliflexus flocculans]